MSERTSPANAHNEATTRQEALIDASDKARSTGMLAVKEPAETVRALMGGLIDYAGLFPPAKLDMAAAVDAFWLHLKSDDAWMLGRFIVPTSRLREFASAVAGKLPTLMTEQAQPHEEPWLISALIDGDLDQNLDSIFAFNHHHAQAGNGLALVDAVEIRVPTSEGAAAAAEFIDSAIESMPEELFPFFEIPSHNVSDCRGLIAALAGADAGAKIRTGGVTPDAIPPSAALAEFLVACSAADVVFKATAGLHHAVRAHYPLTYEPNSAKGLMHGYLNLLVASALVRTKDVSAEIATAVLETIDVQSFKIGPSSIGWRGAKHGECSISADELGETRETFALSYGSCSFDEPVSELRSIGAL